MIEFKKLLKLRGLQIIALIAFSLPLASHAACGFLDKKLSFSDGSTACLDEFSFLNIKGLMKSVPNESYSTKTKKHASFAIAVTAQPLLCPFEQSMQWDWGGGVDAKNAVTSCETKMSAAVQALGKSADVQSCKCEVLIDNGKVKLTRHEFEQKTKLYEKQISLGYKAIQVAEGQTKLQAERIAEAARVAELKKRDDEKLAAMKERAEAERLQITEAAKRLAEDKGRFEAQQIAQQEAERKKRQDLEEQLRIAQQQTTQPNRPSLNLATERRVALVIGNAAYRFNPLKNPVNDANDMSKSLRSVGFDVIEVNNATLIEMREATRRFADKLGNSEVGLVYYSGHGVEVKGKNYLIPVNADIQREYEAVDQAFDASQFLELMDNIRGPNNKRVNILILDACRDNPFKRSYSTNNGLARMDAPGGTLISYATAPGKVAADGVGRNSPYTKHLLQAMKLPNASIEEVFKIVRRNMMDETKGEQIPWENSSLVGDFYFTVLR